MSYIVNGKPVKNVGLITEPSSYGLTATPEDMQAGTTAIVNGKVVEGTGTVFAFATYGKETIDAVPDEKGYEQYGIRIKANEGCNLCILSSNSDIENIIQDRIVFNDIREGLVTEIGHGIHAYYARGYMYIYFAYAFESDTTINYFIGKDNFV